MSVKMTVVAVVVTGTLVQGRMTSVVIFPLPTR
jgi:outer membrane murein-binding lipoprotein Lpp